MAAAGYLWLGAAGSLVIALIPLIVAHCGGSAAWTASTTMLQELTEDRFRGRVFSAEFAFCTFTLAVCSFAAGLLADAGVAVRSLAYATGALMILPVVLWMVAQRAWRTRGAGPRPARGS
jgi:hypothetical protein